jgi:DNA-binding MarR family transcriptional regulator
MEREKTEIVKHALRLGAFLERTGTRLLQDFGLTQQQFIVLKRIEENGPLSQKDICSDLLFEKSNVSKIVRKLTNAGLIRKTFSEEDNRISELNISDRGKEVVNGCMRKLNQWNRQWLPDFTEDEVKFTLKYLRRLSESRG